MGMLSRQNRLRIDNEAGQFVLAGGGATGRLKPLVHVTITSSRHQVNTLDGDVCRLAEKILQRLLRSFCPTETQVTRVLKWRE
jgi:hypothetical protein